MIRILVKDSKVFEFPNSKVASLWVKNFPQIYEHNLDNIQVISDKLLPGILYATTEADEVKSEIIDCKGCGAHLKFDVEPGEKSFTVLCPGCDTPNNYKRK